MSRRATNIPVAEARDVESIHYRFAPLDLGFDPRAHAMPVMVNPADDPIRVSYSTAQGLAGQRRVAEGPQKAVLRILRRAGYKVRVRRDI